jgi:hypothetical protein
MLFTAQARYNWTIVAFFVFISTNFRFISKETISFFYSSHINCIVCEGRLGNKVFQQIAVSLLAEKYDLLASYTREKEFAELGVPLWRGSKPLQGRYVKLTNGLLEELLTTKGKELPIRLWLDSSDSYFQFPWFSNYLRVLFRGKFERSLRLANPWRDRFNANNDTFVHIRLGDMAEVGTRPAIDFIKAVGIPRGHVFVSSESNNHVLVRHIVSHFSATLLDLNAVQTIQFGSTCAQLVLSDGTFSWTIGSMASLNARIVIVPRKNVEWSGNIIHSDWEIF